MAADDGDFAIEIAARLRRIYIDACGVLADMDRRSMRRRTAGRSGRWTRLSGTARLVRAEVTRE